MLDPEEYVEQRFLYRTLRERLSQNLPLQELLEQASHELLATTKLPMAVNFMKAELIHSGNMWEAMERLGHYFHPFATYVMKEAESDHGRLDFLLALRILETDAGYRTGDGLPQGLFMFQFETLCRNHLRYDQGLTAMSGDPMYDEAWQEWIQVVRRQIGLIELADMVHVRSQLYDGPRDEQYTPLFGEKEGRIALASRRKDPLYFFAALQRQLSYPKVPRPEPPDLSAEIIPQLLRRMERLETRMKLLQEEQRSGAADLSQFLRPDDPGAAS